MQDLGRFIIVVFLFSSAFASAQNDDPVVQIDHTIGAVPDFYEGATILEELSGRHSSTSRHE